MNSLKKETELINQVEEQIRTVANNQFKELLKWDPNREFIELELEICKRLNQIGAAILESLIPAIYGDGYKGSKIESDLEDLDERLSYQCESRSKKRKLRTVFGDISIQRAVYSELYSGKYKSFLDEKLRIENKKIDPLVGYWIDLLGTIAPFDEASDILNKIRGIQVSKKHVEISTEAVGKTAMNMHLENVKDIVLDKKDKVPAAKINFNPDAKRTVYFETDGCQLHTKEGWKECKTFMLFEREKISDEKFILKNKKYYSTMSGVGEIKRQLKFFLEEYCGDDEVNLVCIGDGAKWIWNACKELFPEAKYPLGITEILDYYHALEKMGDIKNEVFIDTDKANRFYKKCKDLLWEGNIETLESYLHQLKMELSSQVHKTFVDDRLRYVRNNKPRMRYATFRDRGLCIGSGAIESANKYVVQRRVKLQGMIWNEENLNYMVHLRADYINGEMEMHYGLKSNPLLGDIAVT